MNAVDILETARERGIELAVNGDAVMARPREAITDELRAAIRQHKPELLTLLRQEGEQRRPFLSTPQETAAAIAAWLEAGCPGDPVTTGLALLRLAHQCRTCARENGTRTPPALW